MSTNEEEQTPFTFHYRWEIAGAVAKLEAAKENDGVYSDTKGSPVCRWRVSLRKKTLPDSSEYGISVSLTRELLIPVRSDSEFTYVVDYLDFSACGKNMPVACRRIGSMMTTTKPDYPAVRSRIRFPKTLSKSKFLACVSPTGVFVVLASITMNFHKLAYHFAEHAYNMRARALVKRKYGEDSNRSIEFCNSMPPVDDANHVPLPKVIAWQSLMVEASPVFTAMFVDHPDSEENQTGVVTITDFPVETLKLLVRFIEGGPDTIRSIDQNQLQQLAKIADKYLVKDLQALCLAMLLKSIALENALILYEVGHLLNMYELKTACIRTIRAQPNALHGRFWSGALKQHEKNAMLPHAMSDFIQLTSESRSCFGDTSDTDSDSDSDSLISD